MEGNGKMELEGDGIILDFVSGKNICVLCPPSKSKNLTVDHRITKEHKIRLQALDNRFVMRNKQPFCTICDTRIVWEKVQEHAKFHEITPYWNPPTKILTFFANYVTRHGAAYHCHLCDRAMVHWSDAWNHSKDEGHVELQRKAGKHELAKQWRDHLSKWHRQGITLGKMNQLECRVCEVSMKPDEAESHVELSEHATRKLLFNDSVEKRLRNEESSRKSNNPQVSKNSEQVNSKPSTRSSTAASSTSLQSERVDSRRESESDDLVSMNSDAKRVRNEESSRKSNTPPVSENSEQINSKPSTRPSSAASSTSLQSERVDSRRESVSDDLVSMNSDAKRVRNEESSRKSNTPPVSENSEQINSKPSTRPSSAASSTSLQSERVDSRRESESDDRVSMNSIATECSSTQGDVSVTKKQRAEYHSLVLDSSWITETQHPQFGMNFPENRRENWPANAATQLHFCLLCRKDFPSMKSAKKHKSSSEHVNSLKKYGIDYLIVTEQGSFFCTCCENLGTPLWRICSHIMTEGHLETVENVNREKTVEAENKSKESGSIDSVESQQSSKDPDQGLTNLSEEIGPFGEKPTPPVSSLTTVPGPSTDPKISGAVAKNSSQFSTAELNSNWIFATSDALFCRLIPPELRSLLVINITKKSFYCVICFQEFLHIENAVDHISGEKHVNAEKNYGCDFIARTQKEGFYCKCCDQQEQQVDKIYNHLLSLSHAQRLIAKSQQINSDSLSVQAKHEPKKSEISTKDPDVSQPFSKSSDQSSSQPKKDLASESEEENSKEPKKSEISTKNPDVSQPFSKSSVQSSSQPKKDLASESEEENSKQPKKSEISTKNPDVPQPFSKSSDQSSSQPKKDPASESKEENSKILKRQPNWIIERSSELYKNLVPKQIRNSLTQETQRNFRYCFVCSKSFFQKETVDEHLSGKKHFNRMKQHGFDLIAMNETGKYHCTCCDQPVGDKEKIYRHPMTKIHAQHVREYNQRNGIIIDNEILENWVCEEATQWQEQPESVLENFLKTIKPEGSSYANVCPIDSGQSAKPKVAKKNEVNSSFLETNWIVKVTTTGLYIRVVPVNRRQKSVQNTGEIFFYCLICLEHLRGFDIALAHVSCEEHARSLEKWGCDCIEKISENCYRCSRCEREIKSYEGIYNHFTSGGHAKRRDVVGEAPKTLGHVETNDTGDSRSTSEDLRTVSTNSRSSRDNSCSELDFGKDQDFKFVETDLNWVVECHHSLFPVRAIKNIERARKKKTTYCLICRSFYSKRGSAQRHIASEKHKMELKLHGCNYVEVTEGSKFRCTCCGSKKMVFAKIYAHVTDEKHEMKLREIKGQERELHAKIEPNSKESKTAPADCNVLYLESALNWLISTEHSMFKRLFGKPKKNTSQRLFYCLICNWPFGGESMNVDEAREHIASSSHVDSIERYGCDRIQLGPSYTYYCTTCKTGEKTFTEIVNHFTGNTHRDRVRRERKKTEPSEATSNERLVDQLIEEESKNSVSSNGIEIVSQSSLLPEILSTAEKTIEDLNSLQADFPWIMLIADRVARKLDPEHFVENVNDDTPGERFRCPLCLTVLYGPKMAIDHIHSEQHAKSLKKYGCQLILKIKNVKYLCTCCNRELKNFRRMREHVISDGHLKRVRGLNPSENNEIVEQRIDKNSGAFPTNLPTIEETPRQESQSRNWFPENFLGTNAQTLMDPKTGPEAEKSWENDIFFARDLDWVIDRFHAMFPHRTVNEPHEELASHTGNQIFHCLVCFADFPDAKTTKNHISGDQHKNSLLRFGCNVVHVTSQLNYRCELCQHETKTFPNIYAHVTSDQHAKILCESIRQTSLSYYKEKEARAFENNVNRVLPSLWDAGAFSFDWPEPQERYKPSYENLQSSRKSSPDRSDSDDEFSRNFPKINSAPSTRRIAKKTEQNFELRDEDLNWVVDSNHTLYKGKTPKSSRRRSSKNLQEQSFFCLVCSFNFSGIEAAVMHISSEDHADAIKQFGCTFIQVTPDSKFHCACCNREKNHFYKIYNHILSEAHMDRISEMNRETDEKSPVELAAKESSDLDNHENDIDQSFSENSDLCSTGCPTFSEKPSNLNEETNSCLEIPSCIFVTKRNAKKSYCHICESIELPVATKNLENHINSMRHKFSLKRYGCENIESREDGSFNCACCHYEISNLQNVYLHIKDKKHTSSLIKVKEKWKRVKKATRTVSPANRFKTTGGKPLLSEFIVKKIREPDEISDEDVYEPLEESRQNLLPRYTGNLKKDLEKLNSISGQLDNSNQPQLNSMLITMADKLSQLSKQIADSNDSSLRDKSINFQTNRKRWITAKPSLCVFCKDSFHTLEALHCHLAKHINEQLVSMKNEEQQKDPWNETGSEDRLAELLDPENSESVNPSTLTKRNSLTLDDLTDSRKSDGSSSSFDDSSSSGSDAELGELEAEGRRPVWDREQYSKDAIKAASKKIDLKAVLKELDFQANYIYELKGKLEDLEMGSRMLLVIDKETIYCLVCRERVKNTLKDYSAHLWSLDHCSCLDLMEKDAAAFEEFPDQFSDLDLAQEYMEEISSDTVRCYLCNRDVENETEVLRDHIYDEEHERACASTRSNGLAIFETLKSSVKCDWYGIEQYTCLACGSCSRSEVHFVRHLNSGKHAKEMLRSPNIGRKMLFDYCPTCAVLWYGYRASYSYHVNEVDVHEWLSKDGFYLSNTIRKSAKMLLQHPEDEVDRLIRQLDGIKANEKSKEDSLVDDLQKIVTATFPRAKAYTFGSRVTGLSSQDSDIDIFLDCRNVYNGKGKSDTLFFIDHVYKCLNKHPERWDIQEVLTRCRSPIIRVDHRPTGLACDISFDNGLTVEKTKFIKRIVEVYPTFRKLVLILKMWMGHCDLSGSERISHSSLYWLVIFFLQNEKILPSIAYLISMKSKSHVIAGCEVGVSYDFGYFEADNNTSVTDLLQRFFIFYANFDFRLDVACPLLGEAIPKRDFVYPQELPKEMKMYVKQVTKSKNVEMFRIDSPMCIQDPFDLSHNTTKAARKKVVNQFRTCCLKSVEFMASL